MMAAEAGDYEPLTVRPNQIQRGDVLHVARNQWVRVDQFGHGANGVSLLWLDGFYYPVRIDGSSLVDVRRPAPSGSRDGSDV